MVPNLGMQKQVKGKTRRWFGQDHALKGYVLDVGKREEVPVKMRPR